MGMPRKVAPREFQRIISSLPCCPLFLPTDDDFFDQVATGTLLRVRDKFLLLTAGHVCDELAKANFLIPSVDGFSILKGEVRYRNPAHVTSPSFDWGFVVLDSETVEALAELFRFASP